MKLFFPFAAAMLLAGCTYDSSLIGKTTKAIDGIFGISRPSDDTKEEPVSVAPLPGLY